MARKTKAEYKTQYDRIQKTFEIIHKQEDEITKLIREIPNQSLANKEIQALVLVADGLRESRVVLCRISDRIKYKHLEAN